MAFISEREVKNNFSPYAAVVGDFSCWN